MLSNSSHSFFFKIHVGYMYEADEYDDPDYAEYTPTTTAKGAKRNSHAPQAGAAAGKLSCVLFWNFSFVHWVMI